MMSFNLASSFACKAQRRRIAEPIVQEADSDYQKFKQRMLEEVTAVRAKAEALELQIKSWS